MAIGMYFVEMIASDYCRPRSRDFCDRCMLGYVYIYVMMAFLPWTLWLLRATILIDTFTAAFQSFGMGESCHNS